MNRETPASPDAVWAVVAHGWSYAGWVVGASRIRAVERSWPAAGARIHHSVGAWPALLDDETFVLEVEPGARLRLRARTRPLGEAWVEVTVDPLGTGTRIGMREDVASGPVRLVPVPVRQRAVAARNHESLRRLALLAERNEHPDATFTVG